MNVVSSDAAPTKPAHSSTRLRILFVVLLVLSPYGLWNLWAFGTVMRARYAVSKISRRGGRVILSVKTLDMMIDPTAPHEPAVLELHRSLFGDTSAAVVSFSGVPVADADLSCLSGFRKVYAVCLDNTAITDAGLNCLVERTELRSLSLRGTLVSDAGLQKLQGLVNLQKLQLSGTKISDAGLKYLERLPVLGELDLSRTRVTDAGLHGMEQAPHLYAIDLRGTAASKAERARLEKLCSSHVPR